MPELTEVRLSYSVGAKINLGNYENVDIHASESESWTPNPTESLVTIQEFVEQRYAFLKDRVDRRLTESVNEATESKN